VFFGMVGVTTFGLIFTPVFYIVCRWIAEHAERFWAGKRPAESTPRRRS
jgi:hypothetical protein